MTFQDLEFTPHPNKMDGAVQAKLELPNGITISVIGGCYGLYGDGAKTFEVAAWRNEGHEWLMLSEDRDILGWQSEEDINEIIKKLLGM